MTLQEKINQDLKEAMIAKDETKKSILRVLIGELNRVDKVVDDAKVIAILKRMLDNATNPSSGNPVEAEILYAYIPVQLTTDQIQVAINKIKERKGYSSIKEMGKLMADLKFEYSGRYDGKVASDIIKEVLK